MASLREQVDAILRNKPILAPDDSGIIQRGSESTTGSDDSSDNGGKGSNPPDSASGSGTENAVDPASASSSSDTGTGSSSRARTRARSSSAGNGSTSTRSRSSRSAKEEETFDLGDCWLLLNNLLAFTTGESELNLAPEEADAMAAAVKRAMKYIKSKPLSPATLAWLNLLGTAGVIYGPRVMAILTRDKNIVVMPSNGARQ